MEFWRRREEAADGKDFHNFEYEEFMPPFAWRDDSICHYLLLDLPGFGKEELKIEVNDDSHVLVSGERQVSDDKMVHFEQIFKVPENSDIKQITGKYEGDVLYVVIPKKLKEEPKQVDTGTSGYLEEKHKKLKQEEEESDEGNDDINEKCTKHEEECIDDKAKMDREETARSEQRRQKDKACMVGNIWGMLRKNKGFITSILLAFSLGVLVSHKFHSDLKNKGNLPVVVV